MASPNPAPVDAGTPPPDGGGSPAGDGGTADAGTPPQEGCGPSAGDDGTADTDAPPQDGGGPPAGDGGTADAGTVSALEAPPSLPEHACIPPRYASPPVQAQACAISSVWSDGRRQLAHYDADGRLLELRTNDSAGALISVETHTWQDGLELRNRLTYADGTFDQTDFTYNAQRRLTRRVTQGRYPSTSEYLYDELNRLEEEINGDYIAAYIYDAQGRLLSIGDHDEGYCPPVRPCVNFTYRDDGQLKSRRQLTGRNSITLDDYNDLGQLTHSWYTNGPAGDVINTWSTFDTAGRVSRVQVGASRYLSDYARLTTTFYEPAGWRERFAEDSHYYPLYPDDPSNPVDSYYRRVTHRANFICGTSLVALDEWDTNEDGIVDARRTHERDCTGRLVKEQYSGTPGVDDGPVSRQFFYACP